jgi:hypothetical protein
MAGHDLLHYFLLHEAPRPIADCTFLIGEKFFYAVVIQRGWVTRFHEYATLTVARSEDNIPWLGSVFRIQSFQPKGPSEIR